MTSVQESGRPTDYTKDELESIYSVMCLISECDERARAEVTSGRLQAAFYPVRGLEAVCGALSQAVRKTDYLVSTYRNLGDVIAKGVPLHQVVAETAGRRSGTSKGRGGPMHLADVEVGLMATTGVVGSGLPIAVGLALAAQLEGAGRVTWVTFGDGATSIGAYHEAMNLASLWKLPVVFVCQNNQWAEHTPIGQYAPSSDLADRARSYAMSATRVDGFDPLLTLNALNDAAQRCRLGAGPSYVECLTYRLVGHTGSADYSYMPTAELEMAIERDPTPRFRERLGSELGIDAARLDEIDIAAKTTVDEAFEFAYSSDRLSESEIFGDVFAEEEVARSL